MSDPNLQSLSTDSKASFADKLAELDTDATNNDTSDTTENIDVDDTSTDVDEESEEISQDRETDADGEGTEESVELDIDPNDVSLQLPVSMKKLYEKYPDIKKDFPELIAANFREKEYSEIYPTVEDARESLEKVQTLDKLTNAYFSGQTDQVLAIVKNEDPKAWAKVVDNYLPNLQKVDNNAYLHVASQVFTRAANLAYSQAQQHGNEELMKAVKMMYDWAFGNSTPRQSYGNGEQNPEVDSVKKEREEFETSRHNSHVDDNMRVIGNSIKAQIDKNIDPNNRMTPYVRRNAVNDAYNSIMDSMKNDKKFNSIVNGMWSKAKEAKYSTESIKNIKNAYYGRARQLYQTAIAKVRTEALKGSSSSKNEESKKPQKMKAKDTAPDKNTNGRNNSNFARGMSTADKLAALDK